LAKLIRLGTEISDAILTILKYVKLTTGDEPSQTEVASALSNYFILNEIGNQIKFQRKKQAPQIPPETSSKDPIWKMNMKAGPPKNSFARIGLFYENIQDALMAVKRFVKDSGAAEPSETEIALSLRSSFILSEIKNQIDWQRNDRKKSSKTLSLTK
jgi:hypothetical protein